MRKIAKQLHTHSYKNRLNSRFVHLLLLTNSITSHSCKQSPWFSHKLILHTQAVCLLANRFFVLSSQKYLGINLQAANTVFKKTPLSCHMHLLSRGAFCANAYACVMYACIFGAPWHCLQLTKISETSIKSFHGMKGVYRDCKTAKMKALKSAQYTRHAKSATGAPCHAQIAYGRDVLLLTCVILSEHGIYGQKLEYLVAYLCFR